MSLAAKYRTVQALRDQKRGKSVRSSAGDNGVERTYLRRRIKGIPTRAEVNESRQKLSKRQESLLAKWIIVQGKLGYAPPHTRFRTFAQRMLANSGSDEVLGKKWVTRFLERHPDIRTIKGIAMDYQRLNGATPTSARALHDRLDLPEVRKILPVNRWNMDEVGFMEGMGGNDLVLGPAKRRSIYLKDAHKRTWITSIMAVSADGRTIPPLMIFAGRDVQHQWFDRDEFQLKNWSFTVSHNGWTNNDIAIRWLRDIFIPNTKPANTIEWRLLVLDGHNSHVNEQFMLLCLSHRIYVIYLPDHSSQAFQPLDVGVFSHLKRRFRYHFRELCYRRASQATDKQDFLWALVRAWDDITERKSFILSGWKGSGLWPVSLQTSLRNRFVKQSPEAEKAAVDSDALKRIPTPNEPNYLEEFISGAAKTPKSSKDVIALQRKLLQGLPTPVRNGTRLYLQKLGKALDESLFAITAEQQRVSQLTAALKKAKPTKRKKVIPAPNADFVRLKDIQKVKAGLEAPPPCTPVRSLRSGPKKVGKKVVVEEPEDDSDESEVGSTIYAFTKG